MSYMCALERKLTVSPTMYFTEMTGNRTYHHLNERLMTIVCEWKL